MKVPVAAQHFDVPVGVAGQATTTAANPAVNAKHAGRVARGHVIAKTRARQIIHGIHGGAPAEHAPNAAQVFLQGVGDDPFDRAVTNRARVGASDAQGCAVGQLAHHIAPRKGA